VQAIRRSLCVVALHPSAYRNSLQQDSTVPTIPPPPAKPQLSRKKMKDKLRSAQRRRWKQQALRAAGVTRHQERMLKDAFYGPLTDSESTDTDDKERGADSRVIIPYQSPAIARAASTVSHMPPSSQRRGNDKVRSAERRRRKRLTLRAAGTTSSKGVSMKRRAAAAEDVIPIDYRLSTDARVSKPGWIGRRVSNLPGREFSKQELLETYGMSCFPWDGR